MSIDLNKYFDELYKEDYQREDFDAFLKKVGFKYNVPSIHIAGSNGKGSTANYLANIYRAFGLKVGLFISPALNKVNEMISINGNDISDDDFIKAINENEKLFKKYALSPFEIQTFIAFNYFQKQGVDLAIIECGMGGEIDATNIFKPIAAVITSISLEHTSYLGRSLCEIAYQKAGIIKDEIPVITGILDEEALNTIVEVSKEHKCALHVSVDPANVVYSNNGYNFNYMAYKDLRINSPAYYSLKDACIAIETVNALLDRYPVSEDQLKEGLANAFMPVRMEVVSASPIIIVDGSHNPEGIQNMVRSLPLVTKSTHVHALFACFTDKNIERMLSYLGELCKDITLTTFPNRRARQMDDYFLFLEDYPFKEDPLAALEEIKANYPDEPILITGSLAFAAYMKNLIK